MDNRMRRVSLGAKMLSLWCSAELALFMLVMINTIVAMLTEFSILDQPYGAIGIVLINLILFGLFLIMATGTWLVTTGDERIKTFTLLNVNRLLARGFGAMGFLLIGLMLVDETLSAVFGFRVLASESEFIAQTVGELSFILLAPWAGCTALHYAWLYYEIGLFTRQKARWYGALVILGSVALLVLMYGDMHAWGQRSNTVGMNLLSLLMMLTTMALVMMAGCAVCVNIIRLPYLMKAAAIENGPAT